MIKHNVQLEEKFETDASHGERERERREKERERERERERREKEREIREREREKGERLYLATFHHQWCLMAVTGASL